MRLLIVTGGSGRMERLKAYVRDHPRAVGVGLITAAVAALALAVIIVVSGLSGETANSDPSPSGSATGASNAPSVSPGASEAEPSAVTPSASTDPRTGYALTDIETPIFRSVWVRVLVDVLNVRAAASTTAQVVGVLHLGDLVEVTGDAEYEQNGRTWHPIVGDGIAGWVAEADGGVVFLQPVATPWQYGSKRTLAGIAASGERLVAYGWASDWSVPPYEGTGTRALVNVSTDGDTWEEVEMGHGPAVVAAGGDGGFALVFVPSYFGPTLVYTSLDGRTWGDGVPIGSDDTKPTAAAWGPAGPVVTTISYYDTGSYHDSRVMRIRDGSPSEVLRLSGEWSNPQVEASDDAYVIYDPFGIVGIFVSRDGTTWKPSAVPGTGDTSRVRDIEVFGDAIVAVITDTQSGRTTLARGRLGSGDGSVTWEAGSTAPFGTATIDSIAAGNGTLLALGWDREVLEPMVWRSTDGRSWTDLGVDPQTFGGAIGPELGFAGNEWFAVTDAVYASTDGSTWRLAHEVPSEPIEGPGCPPADQVRTIDLAFLDPVAHDCYGGASLTITAWMPLIDGVGGCCWPIGRPGWLTAPIPPVMLSAGRSTCCYFDAGGFAAYLSPTLEGTYRADTWAEITGHFVDPASAECQYVPLTDMPQRLQSKADSVAGCAARFVIDRIVPTDGP